MKIAGLQKESLIDYPGKISTVIFTQGCNYNCGYCHNPEFKKSGEGKIPEEEILKYLDSRKGWIEGVVISGGEPTLQNGLERFIEKIKERNLFVKLDTNGSNPQILKSLLEKKIIDYVAMDVKGSILLYPSVVGREFMDERDDIGKGIGIVSNFPDYEFRTTIIPINENGRMRWMTPEEIGDTAKLIYNWTGSNEHKYFIQSFKAIEKENGNDLYLKKNLPKEMHETPVKHLRECLKEAKKYLPNANLRD